VSQPSEPSGPPGAAGAVLRHVVVGKDGSPASDGAGAGIAEVVRLILEHARTRPRESLGVITLGVKHAERVDAALRAALAAASAPATALTSPSGSAGSAGVAASRPPPRAGTRPAPSRRSSPKTGPSRSS